MLLKKIKRTKKVIKALEIAKTDHTESYGKAIGFLEFAMEKSKVRIYPIPENYTDKKLNKNSIPK